MTAAAGEHVVPLTVTVRTQEVLRLDPASCPTSPFPTGGGRRRHGVAGRHVGASGSGRLIGTENLLTGQGQFEATATLSH